MVPIAEAYFASQVIGEVVTILSSDVVFFTSDLWKWVIITLSVMAFKGINDHAGTYLTVRFNYKYNMKVYSMYLDQLVSVDTQYHDDAEFKTLQDRADEVISWRAISVINRVQGLFSSLVGLLLVSYIFMQTNPIFIILIIVPVVINFVIGVKFGREAFYIWEYGGEEAKHIRHSSSAFDDRSVVYEAKIYGFGKYIVDIYKKYSQMFMSRNITRANIRYSLLSFTKLFEIGTFAGIQIYLLKDVVARVINMQAYSFYLQNISLVSSNFNIIQDHMAQLIDFTQYVESLQKFMNLPEKIKKSNNPVSVKQIQPKIEFRNVSFKYPSSEAYVLRDVSFVINPGEHIALVGENGAGKSTLIKLLARFYDAASGEILINDINIKDLNIDEYYKLWGILFQNFAKFWLSARENIALGDIDSMNNDSYIEEAAKLSGADKFINALPMKYSTMLSTAFEGGTELSGGQWQKIGIARGLFSSPQLIVLDEPTSALDALAEQEVFESIFKMSKKSTMLMVSHRFSTVRNASRILVLGGGAIVEQGTHIELMKENGIYNKMFTVQAKGYLY